MAQPPWYSLVPAALALALSPSGMGGALAQAAEGRGRADTAADAAAVVASPRPEPSQDPPADPPVIQRLRARGIAARPGGIVGRHLKLWLLDLPDQRPTLVMTSAEGHLIRGRIYDAEGLLLIDMDAARQPVVRDPARRRQEGFPFLTDPPAAEAAAISTRPAQVSAGASRAVWDQLDQATTIEEGRAGAPLVYIFFDPYCAYCHQQWTLLRRQVAGGHLRVRWVAVAVLSGSQAHLGSVLGLLRDPSAATLAGWMQNRQVAPDDSATAKTALGRNLALFQALAVPSVPALLYKDPTGRLVTKVGVTPL